MKIYSELNKVLAGRNLGLLILKYRKVNGISQADFGKKFKPKLTHVSIGRWERGQQLPSRDNMQAVSRILDLPFKELTELLADPNLDVSQICVPKHLTPDKHHLKILEEGVKVWNRWREKHPDIIPQLAGLDWYYGTFDNIELNGIDFSKANLKSARISYISLKNANLNEANLSEAHFDTVCFDNSSLNDADFSQCLLNRCSLNDVWLKRVNFTHSHIIDSTFDCSCLYQSCLDFARLEIVNLRNANLNRTSWNKTHVGLTSISGASFEGVDWTYVDENLIYMSPKDCGIPIKNLASASLVYMDRYNRPVLEQYIEERKLDLEAEAIVYELLDKYGDKPEQAKGNLRNDWINSGCDAGLLDTWPIGPSEDSVLCSCIITDSYCVNQEGKEIQLKYYIENHRNSISCSYLIENGPPISIEPQRKYTRHNQGTSNNVISIKDGIVCCNVHPQSLEDLKKIRALITEQQTEKVKFFVQIVKKVFQIKRENFYQDRKYTLTRYEDNFVLKHSKNSDNLIMNINLTDDFVIIKRSVLKTKHILHFQQVLKKLKQIYSFS